MDVTLPNGQVITDVPEGTTQSEIAAKVPAAWLVAPGENTPVPVGGQAVPFAGRVGETDFAAKPDTQGIKFDAQGQPIPSGMSATVDRQLAPKGATTDTATALSQRLADTSLAPTISNEANQFPLSPENRDRVAADNAAALGTQLDKDQADIAFHQQSVDTGMHWKYDKQSAVQHYLAQAGQGGLDSVTLGLAPQFNLPPQTGGEEASKAVGDLAGFIAGPGLFAAKGVVGLVGGLEHVYGESVVKALAKDVLAQGATLGIATGLGATGEALRANNFDDSAKIIAKAAESGAGMGAIFGAFARVLPDNTLPQLLGRIVGINTAMDLTNGTSPDDNRPLEKKLFDYGLNTWFSMRGAGRTDGGWLKDKAPEVVQANTQEAIKAAPTVDAAIEATQAGLAAHDAALAETGQRSVAEILKTFQINRPLPEVQDVSTTGLDSNTGDISQGIAGRGDNGAGNVAPVISGRDTIPDQLQAQNQGVGGADGDTAARPAVENENAHLQNAQIRGGQDLEGDGAVNRRADNGERDALYNRAVEAITREGRASVSLIQRNTGLVPWARAERILNQMVQDGIVSPDKNSATGAHDVIVRGGAAVAAPINEGDKNAIQESETRAVGEQPNRNSSAGSEQGAGVQRSQQWQEITNQGNRPAVQQTITQNQVNTIKKSVSKRLLISNTANTPEFKQWFGNSEVVDADGKPQVMYHGTAQDISEFRPKQAGAIFLTKDPKIAWDFAQSSEGYKEDRSINNGVGQNILPVYVSAKHLFDPDNQADLNALEKAVGHGWAGPEFANSVQDVARGGWTAIENPVVQKYIKANYDGFYVYESGAKNVAVYDPAQIKSATGNNGDFDASNPDITKSTSEHSLTREESEYAKQRAHPDDVPFTNKEDALAQLTPGMRKSAERMIERAAQGKRGGLSFGTEKENLQRAAEMMAKKNGTDVGTEHRSLSKAMQNSESNHDNYEDTYGKDLPPEKDSYGQPRSEIPGDPYHEHGFDITKTDGTHVYYSKDSKVNAFYHPDLGHIFVNTDHISNHDVPGVILHEVAHAANNDALNHEVMRRLNVSEAINGLRGPQKSYESDETEQANLLDKAAKDAGYKTVDEFAAQAPDEFNRVAENFRAQHPISKSVAPTFYSQLSKAVDAAPDKIFSNGNLTSSWLNANAAKLGIKKAEIEATGIDDWLKLQGKVTKADVQNFLEQNGVQVKEVTLGKGIDIAKNKQLQDIRKQHDDATYEVQKIWANEKLQDGISALSQVKRANLPNWLHDIAASENKDMVDHAKNMINQLSLTTETKALLAEYGQLKFEKDTLWKKEIEFEKSLKSEEPKFASYQLPGVENYKELLLTLPTDTGDAQLRRMELAGIDRNRPLTPSEQVEYDKLNSDKELSRQNFKSAHYDQPNILAHIRFNERTDAEGHKVLFLEELQSDWGQKGKKEGFGEKDQWQVVSTKDGKSWGYFATEADAKNVASRIKDDTVKIEKTGNKNTGVPSAPFVTDTKAWTALALKRMIRYAAENGFDKVAWTTGTQQAARYDLSKQVDRVEYWPESKIITAYKDGQEVIQKKNVEKSDLPDLIGKDVAQKLIDEPLRNGVHQLRGDDLKVGGTGMKGYYDQIVPQVANDILKKLGGGKVEDVGFKQDKGDGSYPYERDGKWYRAFDEDGELAFLNKQGESQHDKHYGTKGALVYKTKAEAMAAIDADKAPNALGNQQGFTITPELRAKVMNEGLPLFSKRGAAQGDIYARVRARMEAAGETGNAKEATSYLVEEAMNMGRTAGHSRMDTAFWTWATKALPESVVNTLRQWVAAVRAAMFRNGVVLKEKDLTIDDFVAVAKANMKDLASGKLEAAGGQEPVVGSQHSEAQAKQTDTPEFKKWFGDSKVVDSEGMPLVVYHGTKTDVSSFDKAKAGVSDAGLVGKAFYFTPTAEQGGDFATSRHYGKGESPNVVPAYISLKNPLMIIDGKLPDGRTLTDIHPSGITAKTGAKLQKEAIKAGHDGVIFQSTDGEITQIVAFKPTQIKSAIGNRGTFDANNPDIRMSRSEIPKEGTSEPKKSGPKFVKRDDVLDEKAPSVIAKAGSIIDSIKSGLGELKDAYLKEPEFTESKRIIGKYTGALQEIDFNLSKIAKEINLRIPADRQVAITNYMQAGGDEAILKQRAATAFEEHRKGYADALTLTPEEKKTADFIQGQQDTFWKTANEAGILEGYVENYVRGQWQKENVAGQKTMAIVSSGMLNDKPHEAMRKVFANYFEGEQLGFVPVDKRIGYQFTAGQRSIRSAIAARQALTDMMHATEKDGRPMVAVGGGGSMIGEDSADKPYFVKPNIQPKDTADYKTIDHPAMRKWKWVGSDDSGKPIMMQGNMYIHPDAYGRLNALLGKSLVRTFELPQSLPLIGGTHPGDAMLKAGAFIKSTMLVGPFHQFHLGEHAVFHGVNPMNAPEIDFDTRPLLREGVEHGLMLYNHNAMHEFAEGLASGGLLHKLPYAGDVLKSYQEWLFQDYIPRLKASMFEHAVGRALEYYKDDMASGKFTRDQLLDNAAKQGNAAFGELNYKYMGRNPTYQDVLRVALLAPDFLEARFKFAGQALRPRGKEQMMALIRGALIMGLGAQTINMMFGDDHKMHWDRPFSAIIGGREYSPRSVVADIAHLITDPRGFWYNRINPLWGKPALELATGKDINGQTEDLSDGIKNVLKSWTPIPVQGAFKNSHGQTQLEGVMSTLLQSIGVTNFPAKTPAEKLVGNIAFGHRTLAGETVQQKKKYEGYEDLKNDYMLGKLNSMDDVVAKAKSAGLILTKNQVNQIRLSRDTTPEGKAQVLTHRMSSFTAEELLQVWEKMDSIERKTYRAFVLSKIAKTKTMTGTEKLEAIHQVQQE